MSLFDELLTTSSRRVPYGNVRMIDSRMWDPNWRYGGSYRALVSALNYGVGETKAINMASQESYFWGRGSHPAKVLKTLEHMSPTQIYGRVHKWVMSFTKAEGTYAQIIGKWMRNFAEGPSGHAMD